MTKRNKILFSIFIAVDVVLVLFCVAQVASLPAVFSKMTFFHPQGSIAIQERNLFVTAVLIMLVAVIPAFFMLFFFAWKYRAGRNTDEALYVPNSHSKIITVFIWAIPATVIFVLSFLNWNSTHALDPSLSIASNKKPITIQVVALQWKFLFIYPEQNIATVNFIEFPVGTPLNFELTRL